MYPTPEDIQHIMDITGMDYIQARNHLIGCYLAQQIAQQRPAFDKQVSDN